MLALTALTPFVIAFAPTLSVTLLGAAATGFGWTGTMTGLLALLLNATPSHAMPRASARYTQLTAFGTFLGPLIGGTLASAGIDLVWVMLFGVGLRLAAATVIASSPSALQPAWYRITRPRLTFAHR
jgi:MFS family permease